METIVKGGVDSGDISRERAALVATRAVEVMMVSDVSNAKGRSSGIDGGGGGGSSGGGSSGDGNNGGGNSGGGSSGGDGSSGGNSVGGGGGGFSPSARA